MPIHQAAVIKESNLRIPANILGIETIIDCYIEGLLCGTLDGQLPIHLAVMSNSNTPVSVVHLLIDKCPEALHRADKYGQLALHKAASNRHIDTDIIDLLIQSFPGGACMKDITGYKYFRMI